MYARESLTLSDPGDLVRVCHVSTVPEGQVRILGHLHIKVDQLILIVIVDDEFALIGVVEVAGTVGTLAQLLVVSGGWYEQLLPPALEKRECWQVCGHKRPKLINHFKNYTKYL